MQICHHCGEELPPGNLICSECNVPIKGLKATIRSKPTTQPLIFKWLERLTLVFAIIAVFSPFLAIAGPFIWMQLNLVDGKITSENESGEKTMLVRVERAIDDPIVTFTFESILDTESIQELKTQTTQLLTEMGMFYGVVDLREIETTVGEAITLLESSNMFSLSANPRVSFIFVGKTIPGDPTNQTRVPIFDNKEDAWEYIRREIAANAPGQLGE